MKSRPHPWKYSHPFQKWTDLSGSHPSLTTPFLLLLTWLTLSFQNNNNKQTEIQNQNMCFENQTEAQEKIMDEQLVVRLPSRFKRVCVFCGSSTGKRDSYRDAAIELGQELVARRLGLVYGGGSIGLMGLVSQTVHRGGCHVLGIIPKTLMGKELTGEPVGEVKAVANMHQRKAEMARHSDCFIALPGGYGTLEELLEVITWAQLGIHDKPVGLLNVDGYYNSLLTFIDKAVDDGFIKPSQRHIIVSAPSAKELVQKLEDYEPVHGELAKASWEVEQPQSPLQVGFNTTPTLQAEMAL